MRSRIANSRRLPTARRRSSARASVRGGRALRRGRSGRPSSGGDRGTSCSSACAASRVGGATARWRGRVRARARRGGAAAGAAFSCSCSRPRAETMRGEVADRRPPAGGRHGRAVHARRRGAASSKPRPLPNRLRHHLQLAVPGVDSSSTRCSAIVSASNVALHDRRLCLAPSLAGGPASRGGAAFSHGRVEGTMSRPRVSSSVPWTTRREAADDDVHHAPPVERMQQPVWGRT